MRSMTGSHTDTRCSITTSVAPASCAACATASRTSRTPAGSRFAVGSSRRIRPGTHREHAGQRESLPLPARERRRGVVEREVEADRVERRARRAARSRRAGRRGSRVRTRRRRRVAPSPPARRDPAGRGRSGRATAEAGRPSTSSSPSDSPSSSPPSTPASPCRSVDLPAPDAPSSSTRSPGPDVEVEVVHGGRASPAVAPSPAPRRRPTRGAGSTRRAPPRQTVRSSRPAANRSSAPARASPRIASHARPPASTAPPITAEIEVDRRERRSGAGVPDDQVVDGHRESGARAGEQRDGEAPVAVQEQREDEFGAEPLHDSGLDR